MKQKKSINWREILGWIIILIFIWICFFITPLGDWGKFTEIYPLVTITVLILAWLKLNERK